MQNQKDLDKYLDLFLGYKLKVEKANKLGLQNDTKYQNELKEIIGKLCDLADELDHHPTVTFGYNTLRIETTTHDAGNRITQKDVELAERVCQLINK